MKKAEEDARGVAMGEGTHSPTAMVERAGSEHAVTPWRIAPHKYDLYIVGGDYLGTGSVIADIRMYPGYERAESVANAEFIVRAVNCHDELVAALKQIVRDSQAAPQQAAADAFADIIDTALAALAKAERT